jgi:cytochrome c-type biogenesis protein CcmH
MRRVVFTCLLLLFQLLPVCAVEPDEILNDPALEVRARQLSAGFRCLVCQNQSIDDSDAPLARDLRLLIRERLAAGETDAEVRSYVVARYGQFVLLKPPFNAATLLLWVLPFLLLLSGLLYLASRRRRVSDADAPLSEDEQRRLSELTGDSSAEGMRPYPSPLVGEGGEDALASSRMRGKSPSP